MICQFASPVDLVDIHKQPEVCLFLGYWYRKNKNKILISSISRQLFWKENTGKENLMLLRQNTKNGDYFTVVYYKIASKNDKN